jgi:hypothetical protein
MARGPSDTRRFVVSGVGDTARTRSVDDQAMRARMRELARYITQMRVRLEGF